MLLGSVDHAYSLFRLRSVICMKCRSVSAINSGPHRRAQQCRTGLRELASFTASAVYEETRSSVRAQKSSAPPGLLAF